MWTTRGTARQVRALRHGRLSRWKVGLLGFALAVMALAGCSSGGEDSATADGARAEQPSVRDCARVAEVSPPTGAGSVVLIVDRTGSGRVQGEPPMVRERLSSAQDEGKSLTIIGVDGPDAAPRMLPTLALDPAPGREAQTAVAAREVALDCVASWMRSEKLLPTVPGSDPLSALAAAGRQSPDEILVVSDGVSTGGALDLETFGLDADPAAVAQALVESGSLPVLTAAPVRWAGLGETATPLPEAARQHLALLWTSLVRAAGAELSIDAEVAAAAEVGSSPVEVPADPMPVVVAPTPVLPPPSGATCLSLPTGLLFGPDSGELLSTDGLRPLADALTANPSWTAHITGHTADYGTREGQLALSRVRADAVVAALRALHVPDEMVLVAEGFGSSRPAVEEWHGGTHDVEAAAQNRRVDVVYGDAEAVTSHTCG